MFVISEIIIKSLSKAITKEYHNIGFCANNRPKSVKNIAARVLTCNNINPISGANSVRHVNNAWQSSRCLIPW